MSSMLSSQDEAARGGDFLDGVLSGKQCEPTDLDARARRQMAVLAFGRRANAHPQLAVLIQDAVALMAEMLDGEFSSVAEVSADGHRLALKIVSRDAPAAAHPPLTCEVRLNAEESMAGYALNTGSAVMTLDLPAEQRFADLTLRKLGVRSALTIPLHLYTEQFGALGVYRREQRAFTAADLQFAEMISHLLAFSIAQAKAEEILRQQRLFAATVMAAVDSLVILLDARGNLLEINRACEKITGFRGNEVRGRPFCSIFAVFEEAATIRSALGNAAAEGAVAVEFDSRLLTKNGAQRRVHWTLRAVSSGGNVAKSLVLSGADRTEQAESRRQLQQAKQDADTAVRALKELRASVKNARPLPPAAARLGGGAADGPTPRRESPLHPFSPAAEPAEQSAVRELRKSPRRSYQYRQLIAPMLDGVRPEAEQFLSVVCRDISVGGISFYLPQPPQFTELVVALGKAREMTYFTASVVRVWKKEVDGVEVYLVGCCFTGRIELEHGPTPSDSPHG